MPFLELVVPDVLLLSLLNLFDFLHYDLDLGFEYSLRFGLENDLGSVVFQDGFADLEAEHFRVERKVGIVKRKLVIRREAWVSGWRWFDAIVRRGGLGDTKRATEDAVDTSEEAISGYVSSCSV